MKALNLITLVLTILAGLDVGVVGLADFDVISYLLGVATPAARVAEGVLGLAALYQLYPLAKAWSAGEIRAESARA
jgi:uncharacterized membrane protein YuzA (DUF378 family)